jgi:hypothetical protein
VLFFIGIVLFLIAMVINIIASSVGYKRTSRSERLLS